MSCMPYEIMTDRQDKTIQQQPDRPSKNLKITYEEVSWHNANDAICCLRKVSHCLELKDLSILVFVPL